MMNHHTPRDSPEYLEYHAWRKAYKKVYMRRRGICNEKLSNEEICKDNTILAHKNRHLKTKHTLEWCRPRREGPLFWETQESKETICQIQWNESDGTFSWLKSPKRVAEMWDEWNRGAKDKKSVADIDFLHGEPWRLETRMRSFYERRRPLIVEIEGLAPYADGFEGAIDLLEQECQDRTSCPLNFAKILKREQKKRPRQGTKESRDLFQAKAQRLQSHGNTNTHVILAFVWVDAPPSVKIIYDEFTIGIPGQLSVWQMDEIHGSEWRFTNQNKSRYGLRKPLVEEVDYLSPLKGGHI